MPVDSAQGKSLLEVRHLVKHFVRTQGLLAAVPGMARPGGSASAKAAADRGTR